MGKHSVQQTLAQEVEADTQRWLKSPFVQRLAEQVGVAFVAGFGGVAFATGGNLTGALLSGALTAGIRGAYGVIVKNFGEDPQTPSIK